MKKISTLLFFLIIVFSLFGCARGETEKIAIATAFGLDKSENGVKVSCQVLNPHVLGRFPREIAAVTVYQEEGETVFDAISKLSKYFQSDIFLSHFQVILISEELAREGIEPYLNFFFSNISSRHKFLTIVTKGITALEVINIQTTLNLIPGISIEQKLLSSFKYRGTSREVYIDEIINDIRTDKANFTLSSLEVLGDPKKGEVEDNVKKPTPEAMISLCGLAVFKEDKLIGWLNDIESIAYNMIMGEIKTTVIPVKIDEESTVSIKINKFKSKIEYHKDKKPPAFTIKVNVEGIYSEDISGKIERTPEHINKVQNKTQEEIKRIIQSCIQKSQNVYNTDFFNFSKKIHQRNPKYWKEIKDNYDQIYKNININVEVKVIIIRNRY